MEFYLFPSSPARLLLFFIITGLPVRPSHKFGFRSSVSKSGLPGERRQWGLVPKRCSQKWFHAPVSYDFLAEPCTDTFCTSFLFLGCVRLGSLDFGFAIEREIRKRISTLRSLFLDFFFTENSFANPFWDFPIDR